MKLRIRSNGFTLIELLVVIAIIGLLSAIVLASLNTAREKGNQARRLSDMHSAVQALELYANDNNGSYPLTPSGSGCAGVGNCFADLKSVLVPKYLPSMPADPSFVNTSQDYRYCSAGADYAIVLWDTALPTANWCRPRTPVNSTACGWQVYPPC